ncbi:glycerophosphodiester phosphodiesterase family protein [Desulfurococcus mucosus]|uniref:glycerophosphodiester phosphodiesterase family protein n=1 Tax=Desulfurococcus mucosus TaxID=2275 RepID=UPI00064F02E9|nr:glycerophosphodiester phosphodiesterase family protein [Desulfurococcus mucosus]
MRHIVIGHRGYPSRYPENTVAGFMGALLAGAHGVELDVWLSADGVPVVIHDESTKRVAGVELDVKKTLFNELRRLHLGMGQCIPSLEDVYMAVPPGYRIYVEIKDVDAVHEAYKTAARQGRLGDTVFLSFMENVLVKLRELDPNVKVSLNVESLQQAERAMRLHEEIGLYSVNPPVVAPLVVGFDIFRKYVEAARAAGLKIAVWDTEGYEYDYSLYRDIAGFIDEVIVNDPVAVRKYLD